MLYPAASPIRVAAVGAPPQTLRAAAELLLSDDRIHVVARAGSVAELEDEAELASTDVIVCCGEVQPNQDLVALGVRAGAGLVALTDTAGAHLLLAEQGLRGWALLEPASNARALSAAVTAVAEGLVVIGRDLAPLLSTGAMFSDQFSATTRMLSARERQVLQLMAQGLANKQIAARLGISLSTVKFHVASILSTLGAASRTEAVTLGIRRGDVSI